MGRGTALTVEERHKISALSEVGLSLKAIAHRIGRTRCVVRSFLHDPDAYGSKRKGKRQPKLSDRDRRRLVAAAANSTRSCQKLAGVLDLKVSRWTVWRAISASPVLRRAKMQTVPRLKKEHIESRLKFGRENMDRDWRTVSLSRRTFEESSQRAQQFPKSELYP